MLELLYLMYNEYLILQLQWSQVLVHVTEEYTQVGLTRSEHKINHATDKKSL